MDNAQSDSNKGGMTLIKGVAIYLALSCFMGMIGVAGEKHEWISPGIIIGTYFACGFVLNRVVLRGLVEWHPVYNTLSNVSRSKLQTFFLWPWSYPVLFFKLAVVKIL